MFPLSFFQRDAVTVARQLLGCTLRVGDCSGMIVETEAYTDDPASHAFKRTERSEIMYSTFGRVYIYMIYGMYYCLNVTTNTLEKPGAVLIRAVEPVSGLDVMFSRRKTDRVIALCSGPGKLCQAFGITFEHHGKPLQDDIVISRGIKPAAICSSPRIGIMKGLEYDWRFYIKDNPFVSR